MKNKIMMLLFFIGYCFSANSQLATINWKDAISTDKSIKKVIAQEDTVLYLLTIKKSDYYVSIYHLPDFHEINSYIFNPKGFDFINEVIAETYKLNDQLIIITTVYDNKSNTQSCFAYRMDLNGKLAADKQILTQVKSIHYMETEDFFLKFSKDSSKLVIVNTCQDLKKDSEYVYVYAYSKDLHQLAFASVAFDSDKENLWSITHDALFNPTGDIYLITERRHILGKTFFFSIGTFDTNAHTLKYKNIELPDNTIGTMAGYLDKDENLFLAGYYVVPTTGYIGLQSNGILGSYLINYNIQNDSIIDYNLMDEDQGALQEQTAMSLRTGSLIPSAYTPVKFEKLADGKMFLISECAIPSELIITYFNEEKPLWTEITRMQKKPLVSNKTLSKIPQYHDWLYYDRLESCFYSLALNNKLFIYYRTDPDILNDNSKGNTIGREDKSVPILKTISGNQGISATIITSNNLKEKNYFQPQFSRRIGNIIYVLGQDENKEIQLGSIQIK